MRQQLVSNIEQHTKNNSSSQNQLALHNDHHYLTSAESVDNTPLKGEGGRSATKSAGNQPKASKKDGPPGNLLYLNSNQAKSSQLFQHQSSLGDEFSPSSAEGHHHHHIDFYSNLGGKNPASLHPIQEITKGNSNIGVASAASSRSPDRRAHKLPSKKKKPTALRQQQQLIEEFLNK